VAALSDLFSDILIKHLFHRQLFFSDLYRVILSFVDSGGKDGNGGHHTIQVIGRGKVFLSRSVYLKVCPASLRTGRYSSALFSSEFQTWGVPKLQYSFFPAYIFRYIDFLFPDIVFGDINFLIGQ